MRLTLALGFVLLTACGDDQAEEKQLTRCEQLREHVIDVRLADAVQVDKDAHREVLRQSLGTEFLGGCEKLSKEVVDCGLAAADSSTLAACSQRSAR